MKCSQEKKKSGIRIIELSIQSEEDILDIVNSTNLNECERLSCTTLNVMKFCQRTLHDLSKIYLTSYFEKLCLNEIRLPVGITTTTEKESMK